MPVPGHGGHLLLLQPGQHQEEHKAAMAATLDFFTSFFPQVTGGFYFSKIKAEEDSGDSVSQRVGSYMALEF